MYALNFIGSSHLTAKHGFPQTLQRHFSQTNKSFQHNFSIQEMRTCPGATFCYDKFMDSFINTVHNQRLEMSYAGQVNVVVMGANDQRQISELSSDKIGDAILKFRSNFDQFVEKLISRDSMLIVLTPIIPAESTRIELNTVIEDIVR
jgi:hypothetical protein